MRRNRALTVASIGVGFFIFLGIAGNHIAPYNPLATNVLRLTEGPSMVHWFGTDELGRDLLSRVIAGAQVSMLVAFVSTAIAAVFGIAIGAISGYLGGWIDEGIMRVLDIILAFPQIVLAIALAAALGPNLTNVIIIIGFLGIPQFARVVRGSVLSVRELDYITAARVTGVREFRILSDHVIPNTLTPILILSTIFIPSAILTEAALSFLGLGIQPPAPSWGNLIADGSQYLLVDPWMAFFPGMAITLTVLAFNFVGDGVRDALDPRSSA
jgi:peptide/nickel transport system permease protein